MSNCHCEILFLLVLVVVSYCDITTNIHATLLVFIVISCDNKVSLHVKKKKKKKNFVIIIRIK